MCAHVDMQQMGVNYLETYSRLVNLESVKSMLTLKGLWEIIPNPVCFVISYNKYEVNSEVLFKMSILFGAQLGPAQNFPYALILW